jgi:hypothetical protein
VILIFEKQTQGWMIVSAGQLYITAVFLSVCGQKSNPEPD